MQVGIQTTQNVDIDYEIASIGDRIVAAIIDILIMAGYFIGLILLAALGTNVSRGASGVVFVLLLLPLFFYHLLCEIFMNGQSFGKRQMKIRVVKLDGSQPGIGSYVLRWLLSLIERGMIEVVVILINGKGQRLGDMAAGTTVVKLKQRVTLDDTILSVVDTHYIPVFPQAARLNDRDAAIIKDVIAAASRDDNRVALAMLSQKTKETLGIESDMPPALLLSTLLKDYNFYAGK